MAFASVGTIGTAVTPKTSSTTHVLTTTATAEVGNLVFVGSSWDNAGTSQADTSQLSCADSSSNVWTKLGERTYSAGAANDGVTVAMWASRITTQLTSGGTITITSTSARVAQATGAWEFTVGGDIVFPGAGYFATASAAAADPATQTLSSMVSRPYLFLHVIGSEGGTTHTPSASYNETWDIETTGGAVTSNVCLHGEYRILTATTDSVNAASATDRDHAQVYAAIYEAVIPDLLHSRR